MTPPKISDDGLDEDTADRIEDLLNQGGRIYRFQVWLSLQAFLLGWWLLPRSISLLIESQLEESL